MSPVMRHDWLTADTTGTGTQVLEYGSLSRPTLESHCFAFVGNHKGVLPSLRSAHCMRREGPDAEQVTRCSCISRNCLAVPVCMHACLSACIPACLCPETVQLHPEFLQARREGKSPSTGPQLGQDAFIFTCSRRVSLCTI
eukprot:SAG31_NODE_20451_length_574_cov_0.840000_1_plen_141_part_00